MKPAPAVLVLMMLLSGAASRAADRTPIRDFVGHRSGVYDVAISPDGKLAASAGDDTTVGIWDIATGKLLRSLQGHDSPVHTVAFGPDGEHVASGSEDGTVRVWNVKTGDLESILERHAYGVLHVVYAGAGPDARILSSGYDDLVRLWDVKAETELLRLSASNHYIGPIAASSDGRRALVCGEGCVRLVDLQNGQDIRQFDTGASQVQLVRFEPDQKHVTAVVCKPSKLLMWDQDSGAVTRDLPRGQESWFPAISPDGTALIDGCRTGSFACWATDKDECRDVLVGVKGNSSACAVTPDGKYLLGGGLGTSTYTDKHPGGDRVLHLWELTHP